MTTDKHALHSTVEVVVPAVIVDDEGAPAYYTVELFWRDETLAVISVPAESVRAAGEA